MAEATSRSGERRDEGRQWLRRCSLLVGPKEGGALEFGELRVAFTVKVSEQETPNSASIRVYNLSEATAGRIRKEFTRVILQAGYQGNCSVIFDGNITKVALGQEGGPGAGKNGGDGFGDFPGIPGPGRIDDKSFHDGSFVPTASRNAKNDSRAAGMS